jgi:hypothetical protein
VFERVLEGQGVEHGGQHSHVIGGGAVHPLRRRGHAAVDVAGAHHDRRLHASPLHAGHGVGDRPHAVGVGAVLQVAHQRLARQLEQQAPEGRGARGR